MYDKRRIEVMLNTDKNLKLYYSIGEVAEMFGVNESLLRFGNVNFLNSIPKRRVAAYVSTARRTSKR